MLTYHRSTESFEIPLERIINAVRKNEGNGNDLSESGCAHRENREILINRKRSGVPPLYFILSASPSRVVAPALYTRASSVHSTVEEADEDTRAALNSELANALNLVP